MTKRTENMMNEEDYYNYYKQKTKLQTSIGCLFAIVISGFLVILVPIWLLISYSDETQLKMSHSPNNINTIEIVQKDDFPDPTIRIKYDNNNIMKTTIPDTISVKWKNDFEAQVILTKKGREPNIVEIKFK